jgi:hypothetical protein
VLTAIPFFLRAATLGNHPDEHLLGEDISQYRPSILAVLVVGGVILGAALLVVVRTML